MYFQVDPEKNRQLQQQQQQSQQPLQQQLLSMSTENAKDSGIGCNSTMIGNDNGNFRLLYRN